MAGASLWCPWEERCLNWGDNGGDCMTLELLGHRNAQCCSGMTVVRGADFCLASLELDLCVCVLRLGGAGM